MKKFLLLLAFCAAATPVLRATPQTLELSAGGVTLGQAVTFTGRAYDPDAGVEWIHFYVNGPGMPGWNHVGSAPVSGNDATGSISWTPAEAGGFNVHIRAQNVYGEFDWNANIMTGFNVGAPNTAPQTNWVSGGDTIAGQPTTLTGNASDPDGNLVWIHFYVNGPGMSGWNHVGSAFVSGADATGSIQWTPSEAGVYTVHIRAQDTWDWYDWNANVAANFSASSANNAPQTNWVSGGDTVAGQATTLTGNASDPDGNLYWIHFYVTGPGMPGWNHVGSAQVGGGNSTGSINWTPTQEGIFTVHIRAQDAWEWYDWNANVAASFSVSAANHPPKTESLTAGSVTLGQATTFTGHVTDPNGNLDWVHFYVTGPGLSGWNHVGSAQVSGGNAAGSINWTPSQTGSYTVHIRCQDTWGWYDWNANVATSFEIATAVDTTPPSTPSGLTASLIAANSFTFLWSASSDNVGVTGYEVTRNGLLLGEFAGTSVGLSGLAENSSHAMSVRARDAAGNWSGWGSLPVQTSSGGPVSGSQTAWWDINGDGIRDEVVGAQSSRFSYYISAWTTTYVMYTSYSVNNYWQSSNANWPNGDQNPHFSSVWAADWYSYPSAYLTQVFFDLNFNLITEPGYDYGLFMDATNSADTNPANWVFVPYALGILNWPEGGYHRVSWPDVNADVVYGKRFFFVRLGKPLGGVQVPLPGGGAVSLAGGSISLGGGVSVSVGSGGIGTLSLPGGGAVSVDANGAIAITGVPGITGVGAGGTITLPGGVVITATASGATISLSGGVVLNVGLDGAAGITFPGGLGVSVTKQGRIALHLPAGTPPVLAQAVDILGKVLQPGGGIVWSAREVIDLANEVFGTSIALPNSGLLGALDLGISSQGVFQVGAKLGDGPVQWITIVRDPEVPAVQVVSRDKFFAGTVTIPSGADELEIEFVNTTSGESLGRYVRLLGGGTKVYNAIPDILSEADVDLQAEDEKVWFVKDSNNPRKLSFYTCFNSLGAVEVRLWKNGARVGGVTHQLVAAQDFADWIAYVDDWVKGVGFEFPGGTPGPAGPPPSPTAGMSNLSRACLIPAFVVIAQVEGLEALSAGLCDGVKQGLKDDWDALVLMRELQISVTDWARPRVADEIMKWRDSPLKRASELMGMSVRLCENFVFGPIRDEGLDPELSTWEGFWNRSREKWHQIRGGAAKAWTVSRNFGRTLSKGFTSWLDDFSARMMVGAERTPFQAAPWRGDELGDEIIGLERVVTYSGGYYTGYLGEQVALGALTAGVTKISLVLVKGGQILATSLAKRTAFAVSTRMALLKKRLRAAALSVEMQAATDNGLRKAAQTPVSAEVRTSVVEIVESALAHGDFDRAAFNLQQFMEKLGQPATNLQRMARTPAREEQAWLKLARYFDAVGDDAPAGASNGWVQVYERLLRFDGDIFLEDRADDFLEFFRRVDGTTAATSMRKSLEEYWTRLSTEGPDAKFWVRDFDQVAAKLYHYAPELGSRIELRNGQVILKVHPNPRGRYVAEHIFTSTTDSYRGLQLPNPQDGRFRIKFSTAEVKDRLKMPRGDENRAAHFESLTRDFPKDGGVGDGGFKQMLMEGEATIEEIFDTVLGRPLTLEEITALITP